MNFTVTNDFDGRLLRDFLIRGISLSRALCTELKKRGGILVNGLPVTVRHCLRAGDTVTLALADTDADLDPSLTAWDVPLDILYEDAHILAVNKPPYMPTHLSHGHRADTLANALKAEFDRRGERFVMRAVNRLDADTSGVVLIAKNRYAADRFSGANLSYEKRYLAICHGEAPDTGELRGYIRRVAESIITRAVFAEGKDSEAAHTRFRTLARGGGFSAVECEPVTGRTHQLRVHLASIGHPIVGDDLYGGGALLPRQALHAFSLSLVHPITGEALTLTAPLPTDMEDFLKQHEIPCIL